MPRDEVKSQVSIVSGVQSKRLRIKMSIYENNPQLLHSIIHYTSFIALSSELDLRWPERIYCIINDIKEMPVCNRCSKPSKFRDFSNGYNRHCEHCSRIINGRILISNLLDNIKRTISDEYEILTDESEISQSINREKMQIFHKVCGKKFSMCLGNGLSNRRKDLCPYCFGNGEAQRELAKYIEGMGYVVSFNNRQILDPYEIDVFIPKLNIGIEYNGNYWHSSHNGDNRSYPNYHILKTKFAKDLGVRLIHIFEDEWINKPQIVKSRLRAILNKTRYKIYARKCEVKEISSQTKAKFLNKYHIQGTCSSSINLGLFYRNMLIAVMTFGKRRFDKKEGYELIRYCTVSNFTIIGGAGKLLKYFERNWNPSVIISYADLRWSTGNLYKQLGFSLIKTSPPNYWYVHKSSLLNRESRIKYQKHKLSKILDKFDINKTELENMKDNGYDKLYDCGNLVFEKRYK